MHEYADVLDSNTLANKYVLQEDKSLQTKMIIKKKQMSSAAENDEFHPFDEEIQYRFYRDLPDYSRFVYSSSQSDSDYTSSSSG